MSVDRPRPARQRAPSLSRRALFGLFGLAAALPVRAQSGISVLRGPILVTPTPTSMTIRWRTSVATESVVRFGTSTGSLNQTTSGSALVTDHSVTLSGLTPNTRYFYSVGNASGALAGGNSAHSFLTFPTAGSTRASRIWVIGDAGTGFPDQAAVRDAYASYTGSNPTHLWLQLGDNAYNSGTDAEFQSRLFGVYPAMLRSVPTLSAVGNHELSASVYHGIYDAPSAGQAGGVASNSQDYYAFDMGNIHFVCLDSTYSSRASNGTMLNWLRADLAANTRAWTIAYFHHAPYSDGSHATDDSWEIEMAQMRQNALPILESHGVDLVMGGHSHVYERSCLLNGHYGLSSTLTSRMKINSGNGREDGTGAYLKPLGSVANRGTVYIVNGAGGGADPGSLRHPVMVYSAQRAGSVVIDVVGNRLDVTYVAGTGAILDYFTILKTADAPVPPPNQPPTIAITAPTPGSSFRALASITLTAAATDDGRVARVQYFRGNTLLATVTTAPYRFVWQKVPRGSYTLRARATDDEGAVTTSAAVTVTVR